MSFLNTTAKLLHTTALPPSISRSAAIARLQDHEFFLSCDPHLKSQTALSAPPSDADPKATLASLPEQVKPIDPAAGVEGVHYFEVVDHLPNPVWDSNVMSKYEFVDFEGGLWARIKSPMGVVMDTVWSIKAAEESSGEEGGPGKEGLVLEEDVNIHCSKLLVGIIKGQVEGNWRSIHEKVVARLESDAKGTKSENGAASANGVV